jgi:hypothetical protein
MSGISRRTLLRGIGGAVVGLPLLECMLDRNGERLAVGSSSGMPTRYALLFAGQAIGGDNWQPDRYRLDGANFTEAGHFIAPPQVGAGYDITTPLEPLADLTGEFSLVSNLRIPFNTTNADPGAVPAGGAYRDFHGGGCSPLLSGTRSTSPSFVCNGPTSDQLIADLHDGQTTHRSLVMRAQVPFYLTGYDHSGRQYLSYRAGGTSGRVEAQTSPRNAYLALFGNFTPDDPEAQARLDFQLRSRRSVLDLVGRSRERITNRVGAADRERLDRHFDEIRALEQRLAAMPPDAAGACELPPDPGPDPAIGGDNTGTGSNDITSPSTGYSDEHTRARVMCDLIHMAFVCDLTRVASLQITAFQSHMSCLPVSQMLGYGGFYADVHELGHNGDVGNRGQLPVSVMLQWHLSHYAYLLQKLRDTPEGSGNALDRSVVVFTPEAGHGLQLNDASSQYQTHSVENMVMLVGGRAGGLQPGRHIRTSGAHPARCLLSAMRAAGYSGDTFGEVSGDIPELFG